MNIFQFSNIHFRCASFPEFNYLDWHISDRAGSGERFLTKKGGGGVENFHQRISTDNSVNLRFRPSPSLSAIITKLEEEKTRWETADGEL